MKNSQDVLEGDMSQNNIYSMIDFRNYVLLYREDTDDCLLD